LRFEPSGGLPIASEIQVELDPAKVIQEGQVFTGETKVPEARWGYTVSG
jgi:hypothetical protein